MKMMAKRGELWWADMGTGVGSEQRGERPVLMLQNDIGNFHSPTVIVAAVTDGEKKHLPTHIQLGRAHGLPKDSVAMLEQIRTIDKRRLINRICRLNDADMSIVDSAIRISLGLET